MEITKESHVCNLFMFVIPSLLKSTGYSNIRSWPREECDFSLMCLFTNQEPLGLAFLLHSLILQDLKVFNKIDLTEAEFFP